MGGAALYTSLAPETAQREADRGGMLQPATLVAYEADIEPLRDGRDAAALQPLRYRTCAARRPVVA